MKTDPDNPLAADLRAAMAASGLSRFQIARNAGLPYAVIHGLAAGKRDLLAGTVVKIADALGLRVRLVRCKTKGGT